MDRKELGKKPITGDSPSGSAIRYEPEFEELQAEIDKMVSISGGIPDWKKVVELSEQILKEKSKDLLVASYLCGGLLETEGLAGLAEGLTIYKDLVSDFWPTLFPPLKRKRGRVGAVEWLSDRLEKVLERREPSEKEAEPAQSCKEVLKDLDSLLAEHLQDDAPTLLKVLRLLDRWPEPEVQEEKGVSEETKVEKKVAAPPEATVSVGEISSDSDFQKVLRQLLAAMRKLSGFLLRENKSNPLPYRLIRQGVWLDINDLPPNENYKTKLPYPGQLKDRLDRLLAGGNWEELLVQAESLIPERPLWLDLQRFTATALSGLGKDYVAARQSVLLEVRGFLERLPGVDKLLFANGEPFADFETASWIEREVLDGGKETVGREGEPSQSEEKEGAENFWETIQEMKSRGEIAPALSKLRQHLWQAASEREAFRRRLELARFCIDSGLFDVAAPHLRFLEEKIKEFKIDSWEPPLAIPALVALYKCEQTLASKMRKVNPEHGKRLDSIYASICKLDPAEALSLKR